MANTADKVIAIAAAEVGYLEKSASAYKKNPVVLDKKTEGAGSDNYTKYGRDMHKIYPSVMDFPAYWCDCFVDWCFYKAYGVSTAKSLLAGDFNDYTVASANMYKKKGGWIEHDKTPKAGDQVFFVKSGTKQIIDNICHTGLVYKVANGKIYTYEGNTSSSNTVVANGGCVAAKEYSISYNRIAGYGRPKYDSSSSSSTSTTSSSSSKSSIPTLAVPTLKKGSSGDQVKNLQKDLNYVMKSGLSVDGSFGTATQTAVKAFQKKYGLSVDGTYGPKSQAKMKTLLK
jgi:hypothetical protein